MKVDVFENRAIKIEGAEGTQNENNIHKLEINVPEKYKDYNKKIVFITDDGIDWDTIEGNTYTIKRNVSKYKYVPFYIWLTKGEDDFRSVEKILKFNDNHDASNEISEEELGAVNKIINLLEEEIIKVTGLEARLTVLIENVQFKLDNGEFNYILTEEDKQEISNEAKELTEIAIQPILEENVQKMKEYTDNEIATFDFIKIVDVLPETGLPNRIYFVPKTDSQTQDLFDEYTWVNDTWEWITTKQMEIDLTNCLKKDEVDEKTFEITYEDGTVETVRSVVFK